ncbi:hypothetical protein CSKR_101182 [Clonorchis sinensis]|uniref:Uncharacterized protein n=1 Tax=Clonorchis sinensis TaxID=79923 RepID=A0A419Q8R6_CLOSI|nr:hypothetical protein CSKR_101182 [Clonorchis sinensis]
MSHQTADQRKVADGSPVCNQWATKEAKHAYVSAAQVYAQVYLTQSNGMAQWLERIFTDQNVRGSNPTSASRLPLSRFWQPGSIPTLVLVLNGVAAGHRKGA